MGPLKLLMSAEAKFTKINKSIIPIVTIFEFSPFASLLKLLFNSIELFDIKIFLSSLFMTR